MIKPAERMSKIPFSAIRRVFDEVDRLRAQGKDIISLGIGEPNFDTPENIIRAMEKAAESGATHYTANKGILPLRRAIAEYLAGYGLSYSEEEIICTVGVAEAIFMVFGAYLEPGDEVLVPDPAWVNYANVPVLSHAKAVPYTLRLENDFQIDVEELQALVTDKTKILVLIDPSNPTGAVQSRETLEKLAEFAVKNDLLVISDEIYDQLIYDGLKHLSVAALPGMRERTVVLNGFSKSYAMTGWRVGYAAAPIELIPPMAKMHAYMVTNATSMAQYGALEALTGPQDSVRRMREEFERRRDFVVAAINAMPYLRCNKPRGAFYVLFDVAETGMSGEEFVSFMIRHGVAMVPGTAFGESGKTLVRLSYAASTEALAESMERMRAALEEIRAERERGENA